MLARPGANSVGVAWPTITDCGAEVVIVRRAGSASTGPPTWPAQVSRAGVLPPGAEVWAVDADAFVVRPGPRVVEGVETFAAILHPDRIGPPDPATSRRERSSPDPGRTCDQIRT